ncbi:hypothetical protein CAPTEDRAFT_204384 [Capitella teleta]|uniref:Uncharacterized protein n=1 Tax=Capitella teleta TaxID=283909 RepID=R7U2J3_CAPTE|nr:hypothetical protein CAPTEDRAFT_204384 [Capitella teleta]|eukprot:ELT97861.1 hypothetical protein CAPTEDRAFT_204384 [Capitella teleta]
MGALSSKKRRNEWNWSGPPGDHSPFPLDPIPYPGSDLLYCFVDIMASYHIMGNNLNLGHQAVTTNIDELIEEITDCYDEGFTLNDFVKVPVVATTTEIQDWGQKHPYQAILSKPALPSNCYSCAHKS